MHHLGMENTVVEFVDPGTLVKSKFQRRVDLRLTPEFVESIRTHGVIEPIVARRVYAGDGSQDLLPEILCGERRAAGAIEAGNPRVPVIFREATDSQAKEIVLIENLQRVDLTPLEECDGYTLLYVDGWKPEQIAAKVGKPSGGYVARRLNLRFLTSECKQALAMVWCSPNRSCDK